MKNTKGITLVALVVTVIILLILAGISIASLTGNGLFEKAKLAKEKQANAEIKEDETLGYYENKISELTSDRANSSSNYKVTILWDTVTSSGDVTFLNNHNINEFDTLKFLYGYVRGNEGLDCFQEKEITKESWKYIIEKKSPYTYLYTLYGCGNYEIEIYNLKDTGFSIGPTNEYSLFRVYGINY